MNQNPYIINQVDNTAINRFFGKIYGLVAVGIGVSALVAYLSLTAFWPFTRSLLLGSSFVIWLIMLAEIGLVFVASRMAAQNSPLAFPLFLAYSVMNGFTFSIVLLAYTGTTVLTAFLSATLMFVVMAVIGLTTKKNLSAMGQALYAALFGVIIASLINLFLASSGMSFVISIISVLIFSGLIAYDNQRIRYVFEETNGEVGQGWVVSMALSLYLDFVNLFLSLLRIFGSRD
ncbi:MULTISPECIES: Bax inhibitor-1/YccA family protein [unclassified Streptococcus]|uniref:Bax inhibitor-1/YccA family protein n=1 Tax=unclassified Streptococcus TaxID=2608887 RepID=UPI0010716D9D|nr:MULTISPECIES: Bax inhibitor-1/YccA family protein [unclassified Streptococcus]MBF0787449.1 Bax inhibitor-1/YccA family protein [Streptococcus sp. 19428wC2_LYSM12]MCQ9212009.1 Bax inhibitor-1/YccA family protein [Streptococcus sp. B01]MCQ9213338.1 Bax inhibitor-1/YccA family protein [Streptococcus sp. O1]TFV05533.1 Bax inhibitor-1/YccA family protein [Streptococcus sp. LYSM12]